MNMIINLWLPYEAKYLLTTSLFIMDEQTAGFVNQFMLCVDKQWVG